MTRLRRILTLAFLFAARTASADCQLGDVVPGAVIDCAFTTATSVPATLSGSPVVSLYCSNSAVETTTGVTLTADFDSRTGLNQLHIDTTSYAAGQECQMVVTTGTVGGASVVGYVVGGFSLSHQSALRPTTAGRTLDVSAGGEAGIDWANIGSPTTTVNLSGTTVSGSAPSAATNAAAVWDYLTSAMTTSNSIGSYLLAKLALINAASITIRPGVSLDGSFDIVAGDSYTLAEGTQKDFSVGAKPWPTDLTSYTVSITVDAADGTTLLTDTLSIVTATGASRTVRWTPTATKTAVTPGVYRYSLRATKSAEVKTLEIGTVRILANTF